MTYDSTVGVIVGSDRDGRDVPLFPCLCGDNGCVAAWPVEHVSHSLDDNGISSEYDVALDCVPMQFMRLGPRSRALVMSFYRALVERFCIMRAVGDAGERPFGGAFAFGSCLVAANDSEAKLALAGADRRRAFGRAYRRAFRYLVRCAYPKTACVQEADGVKFYPPTPFASGYGQYPYFGGNRYVGDLSDGRPLGWWCADWKCIVQKEAGLVPDMASSPWTWDNIMQRDLYVPPERRRPWLSDFARAYRSAGGPDADALDAWLRDVARSEALYCSSRTEMFSVFTGFAPCHSLATMSVGGIMCKWFPNCLTGECGNPTSTFSLPALAFALRLLSTLNAQTVDRGAPRLRIPHLVVDASRTAYVSAGVSEGAVTEGPVEFTAECVHYDKVVVCAKLGYAGGHATRSPSPVWYNIEDRVPRLPPEGAEGYWSVVIPSSCWEGWSSWDEASNPYSSESARVTYRLVKPKADRVQCIGVGFSGPAYPARWAVREDDVAFGAVSAFAWDSCGDRMWYASSTDDPEGALDGCADLMEVLARRFVASVAAQVEADAVAGVEGNTFSEGRFPKSEAEVWREATGDNLHGAVEAASRGAAAAAAEGSAPGPLFSEIRVSGYGSGYSVEGHVADSGAWESLSPSLDQVQLEGTWYRLGRVPGYSAAFDYRDRYEWVDYGGGEGHLEHCTVRHGWAARNRTAQFGGFFGHFVFNNRAARQMERGT